MANCQHKRLVSERGASLSFALFLVLVCAAVSAIVLAAATASAGQFAELGEYDQRYYSVTSAAGLFRDSLDANRQVVYRYTQTRVAEGVTVSDLNEIDGSIEFNTVEIKQAVRVTPEASSVDLIKGFANIIIYKEDGQGINTTKSKTIGDESEFFVPTAAFLERRTPNNEVSCTVTPAASTETLNDDVVNALKVWCKAKIDSDFKIDMMFANQEDVTSADPANTFTTLLTFQVTPRYEGIDRDVEIISVITNTDDEGNEETEYKVNITETRTDYITLNLENIIPGGTIS